MKKHPVFFSCLTIVFIICLCVFLVVRDFFKVRRWMEESKFSSSGESGRLSYKIGLKEITKIKKLSLSDTEEKALNEFDQLMLLGKKYCEEITANGSSSYILHSENFDENTINKIIKSISIFNKGMNWKLVKNLEWDIFADFPERKLPFYYLEAYNASRFLFLFGDYYMKKYPNKNFSFILTSALKTQAMVQLSYLTLAFYMDSNVNDYLHIYYDRIIKNECPEKELEYILKNVIEFQNLLSDYMNKRVKYDYEFLKRGANFAYREIPFLTYTIAFFTGDPYKCIDTNYKYFLEKNYKVGTQKARQSQSLFVPPSAFKYDEYHEYTIETESFISIFRANLERKLNKPVTAKDPYDGKDIRSVKNDDGSVMFYCLGAKEGIDRQGKGSNIINCDNEKVKKLKNNF